MTANPREERAAAVAQFLMRGGPPGDASDAATAATSLSASQHSGLHRQDSAEHPQKWTDSRKQNQNQDQEYQQGLNDAVSQGAMPTIRSEDDDDNDANHTAEGSCLGTLTIPLSRLPLEDAFIGNNSAVVERWYQLDDPNLNSKQDAKSSAGEDTEHGSANGGDGEPTLLHGPRRCPSVLLEITFASSDCLDESEDVAGWDKDAVLDFASLNLAKEEENAPQTPSTSPDPWRVWCIAQSPSLRVNGYILQPPLQTGYR